MREKGIVLKSIEKLEKCLQVSGPKASESIVEKILELKTRITTFDRFVSNSISEKNAKKIKDHFTNLTEEGHFSASKMWAIKKKLNLNKKDAGTPSAKFDAAGNLITTREGLLQLYRQTYIDIGAQSKMQVLQSCEHTRGAWKKCDSSKGDQSRREGYDGSTVLCWTSDAKTNSLLSRLSPCCAQTISM